MMFSKIKLAGVALAAALSLGGCADDYGYGGVNVGYGAPYYGGGYYDGYGGYGGFYDGGYFGWYGDYYYPGFGYYVYDRYRRPYRWNGTQQRYWEGRRGGYRGQGGPGANWGGFDRSRGGPGSTGVRGGSQGNGAQGYRGVQGYQGGVRGGYPGGGRGQGVVAPAGGGTPSQAPAAAGQQQAGPHGSFGNGGSRGGGGGFRGGGGGGRGGGHRR